MFFTSEMRKARCVRAHLTALNNLPPNKTATNGVVIATEKKLPSPLVDESSMEKIQMYTDGIGVLYSGMGPDFRVMVRKGQKTAAAYKLQYGVGNSPPSP